MSEFAKLELDGKVYEFPIITGTEGEKAIDIRTLRATTGHVTLDSGFGNTGAMSGMRFGTFASNGAHSYSNSTDSFYLWGCQFESGAYRASSYIPVTGLTAGAEVVSIISRCASNNTSLY